MGIVCVHASLLRVCVCVWQVSCASATEEIHFTLSVSFKEVKTFRHHFCHLFDRLRLHWCYGNMKERWSDEKKKTHAVKPRTHCSCSFIIYCLKSRCLNRDITVIFSRNRAAIHYFVNPFKMLAYLTSVNAIC